MADADLKAIRDLFSHDTAEWKPIRDEGMTDMSYAAGDPWKPEDRAARLKANRPCINADELSQYVNQVVNEVRSNKRAVKFTPIGNGANDKSAQFYADKMREIEYRSRAQMAYTIAFENCVQRSFGFVRVNKRYQHARAVHMDLYIDPVHNPNLITPDAEAQMADLSDMRHCWVREQWSHDDFNAKFSDYKLDKLTAEDKKVAGSWMTDTHCFVGEYWKVKTKRRKLLIVQPPDGTDAIGIFEDELKGQPLPGQLLGKPREVDDPTVVMQLTNGLDILEENEWEGKYIPIIGCLGKVLYVAESGAEKRQILSMIRLARDPQMLYAYLLTNEAEVVGAIPRFPYFVREGSLDQTNLNAIAASIHEPIAVIQVKAWIDGTPPGTPVEFPQRNPYEPPLQAIEIAKEAARRAIQASMGQTPLPTAAQRRNEKSGVALKHIDELGQRGSYHFTDHYLDMITHVGIVIEDLMDKAGYDATRDTGIRKDDDTAETIRINDPNDQKSISTKGDHLVTVSTGPNYDSEREAGNDLADSLIENPQLLQMIGPQKAPQVIAKSIKLKNVGVIGDQLAEIIDPAKPKDGAQPTPEQLQQQLEQAQGQMQEMGQLLQQAQQEIQTDAAKQKATLAKAQLDAETDLKKTAATNDNQIKLQILKNEATIAVAHIAAASKGMALDAHAQEEAAAMGHEVALTSAQHEHDRGMAERGHEQSLEQDAQGHAHALEQGQVGHEHALEQNEQGAQIASAQMEQQAALEPPEVGA